MTTQISNATDSGRQVTIGAIVKHARKTKNALTEAASEVNAQLLIKVVIDGGTRTLTDVTTNNVKILINAKAKTVMMVFVNTLQKKSKAAAQSICQLLASHCLSLTRIDVTASFARANGSVVVTFATRFARQSTRRNLSPMASARVTRAAVIPIIAQPTTSPRTQTALQATPLLYARDGGRLNKTDVTASFARANGNVVVTFAMD